MEHAAQGKPLQSQQRWLCGAIFQWASAEVMPCSQSEKHIKSEERTPALQAWGGGK